ncbi:MAG: M23 family metallopeptidase, partial [Actinobacteria bacterium]|nr:M23 family metallopeptidase [Actinomycetota bacterium]
AIDSASSAGGPIFAAYKGTVVEVGGDGFGMPGFCPAAWWRGQNQTVVIRHVYKGKVLYSAVNHVAAGSSKALGIRVGTRVRSGQQIATEGMSGCTSGPHTHFVMRKTQFNWNGEVKPLSYIGKPKPLKAGAGARSGFGVYGTDLPVLRVG